MMRLRLMKSYNVDFLISLDVSAASVRSVTKHSARMNTAQWLAFTKLCSDSVKIFAQSWPGFNFSSLFLSLCFSTPLSVLRVPRRKWMAVLEFDLHKEHQISISQPCCYSFSAALSEENRKQREKRGIRAGAALPLAASCSVCHHNNCSSYADFTGWTLKTTYEKSEFHYDYLGLKTIICNHCTPYKPIHLKTTCRYYCVCDGQG